VLSLSCDVANARSPIAKAAKTGLANAEWTELLDGPIKAGDSLVTAISEGSSAINRP